MALVYIDDKGHLWSPNRDLLHAFAAKIGLKREWFQDRPRLYHYDAMTPWRRRWALKAGAFPVSSRDLIRMVRERDVEISVVRHGLPDRQIAAQNTPSQGLQELWTALTEGD